MHFLKKLSDMYISQDAANSCIIQRGAKYRSVKVMYCHSPESQYKVELGLTACEEDKVLQVMICEQFCESGDHLCLPSEEKSCFLLGACLYSFPNKQKYVKTIY